MSRHPRAPGTGSSNAADAAASMIPRGPVSWASLGLVAVAAFAAFAAASAVRKDDTRTAQKWRGGQLNTLYIDRTATFSK